MRRIPIYQDEDDFEEILFEADPAETVTRARIELALKEFRSSPEKRSILIDLKEKDLVCALYKEVLSQLPLHFTKRKFKEKIKDIRLEKNEDILLEGIRKPHFIETLYDYCQTRNHDIREGKYLREFQFIKDEVSSKRIKLEEKYKKTTFPFLEELADRVYQSPRDIEEIFNSYNLDIKLITFSPDFSKEAVCNATISKKKKITIYLNTRFIVDSLFKGRNKELFKRELELALVHENTHEQQFQNRVDVVNRFFSGDGNPNDPRGPSFYYTAPGEMDAFARELAFDLEKNNVDPNSIPLKDKSYYVENETEEKIASFCAENHLSRTSANILMAYNLYAPGKIINRFLKRVYFYLKEED
jgi:hypothetical protein